jgi:hypothetical protein
MVDKSSGCCRIQRWALRNRKYKQVKPPQFGFTLGSQTTRLDSCSESKRRNGDISLGHSDIPGTFLILSFHQFTTQDFHPVPCSHTDSLQIASSSTCCSRSQPSGFLSLHPSKPIPSHRQYPVPCKTSKRRTLPTGKHSNPEHEILACHFRTKPWNFQMSVDSAQAWSRRVVASRLSPPRIAI